MWAWLQRRICLPPPPQFVPSQVQWRRRRCEQSPAPVLSLWSCVSLWAGPFPGPRVWWKIPWLLSVWPLQLKWPRRHSRQWWRRQMLKLKERMLKQLRLPPTPTLVFCPASWERSAAGPEPPARTSSSCPGGTLEPQQETSPGGRRDQRQLKRLIIRCSTNSDRVQRRAKRTGCARGNTA